MKKNGAIEEGFVISGRVFHLQWVRYNNFYNFEIIQFLKRDILYSLQILLPGRRWWCPFLRRTGRIGIILHFVSPSCVYMVVSRCASGEIPEAERFRNILSDSSVRFTSALISWSRSILARSSSSGIASFHFSFFIVFNEKIRYFRRGWWRYRIISSAYCFSVKNFSAIPHDGQFFW